MNRKEIFMKKLKNGLLKGSLNLRLGKKTLSVSKKIIAAVLVVIIAAGGFFLYSGRGAKTSAELITARVTRGDINSVIEGTGTIEAINQYEVTSLAKGDITVDYFEEGDYVTKGQLLYEIDSSSVSSNISKAESSVEKAQMNYDQAVEDASNLYIKSDVAGVITELNVKKGDQVSNGMTVAKVIDKDNLILNITFNTEDAKKLYIGQDASVSLENSFTEVYGNVSRIASGSTVNSFGVAVTNVEIYVRNPGSIVPGQKATAIVGDYACNDAGTFEYKNESTITAKTSGKVVSLNHKTGDSVSYGETLVVLQSDSTNSNVKSSKLSLDDAKLSLRDSRESLDDYRITAPIDGKVIEKDVKAGEKLDQNSSSTMAIIADLSTLVFEMSIDELDIGSIEVGQKVDITADAMEDKTFTGYVSNISIVGTSAQGVTSYPVKVTIENGEESGLIPGMNVTGDIVVESVSDVLRVPVSAVRRGNFVIVKDDGNVADNTSDRGNGDDPQGAKLDGPPDVNGDAKMPKGEQSSSLFGVIGQTAYAADETPSDMTDEEKSKARTENMKNQLDVPDGYTVVQVETGLSDGTFIEIKSGLSEGQTVLLPDTSTDDTSTTNQQQGMMPGGGGMPSGGGMPGGGGGMPGGGGGMPGGR